MKNVLVVIGGASPEHEVSIITGLQVVEHIDRSLYIPHVLFITKEGEYFLLQNVVTRKDFLKASRSPVTFGVDKKGGFIQTRNLLSQKIYPNSVYLALHGGPGESGQIQGLFESLGIAYTSSSVESSAVSMNKALTKEVVSAYGVPVIPGTVLLSQDVSSKTKSPLKLPVIVKPAHLGSSIGVVIAKTPAAFTKAIMASSLVDSEIVVEKLMTNFIEYNCSVREVKGKVEASEVERPLMKDEILSFADKYERGGGKKTGGMASLSRDFPANIPVSLRKKIQETSVSVFKALRAGGVIRCDFMYTKNTLYLIEVNPIPGSMAFYLWEASGVSFTSQITDLIEESLKRFEKTANKNFSYSTNIVDNFVNTN